MTKRIERDGYSLKEVAAKCGVHPETVRRWFKKNLIKGGRVGPKLLRIPEEEVKRLIEWGGPI